MHLHTTLQYRGAVVRGVESSSLHVKVSLSKMVNTVRHSVCECYMDDTCSRKCIKYLIRREKLCICKSNTLEETQSLYPLLFGNETLSASAEG